MEIKAVIPCQVRRQRDKFEGRFEFEWSSGKDSILAVFEEATRRAKAMDVELVAMNIVIQKLETDEQQEARGKEGDDGNPESAD